MPKENENVALARSYFNAVFNEGSVERASSYFSDNLVIHDSSHPTQTTGGKEYVRVTGEYLKALAPTKGRVEDLIASGEKVVVRWTFQGMHNAQFMDLAPTHKPVFFEGVTIFRMENGKIAEAWELQDTLSLLQQLELVPPVGHYSTERAR